MLGVCYAYPSPPLNAAKAPKKFLTLRTYQPHAAMSGELCAPLPIQIEQPPVFVDGEVVGHPGNVVANAPRRALSARAVAALLPGRRQQFRLGQKNVEQLTQDALG